MFFSLPLFTKEIRTFLSSLIGYIVIAVFLVVTGIFLWVYPDDRFNIFMLGQASLERFFDLAPYVFLLLIPAITMRSFAEERRVGTMELLMTKPLSDYQIILSKFLAGFVLVILSILPTIVYFFCIKALRDDMSEVDAGVMVGSYIGLLFLGGAYVAMGIFASSLTKNQVVAFVLAVCLCLFIFMGFEGLSVLMQAEDSLILELGINDHFRSIKRGLVDLRDLVYFVSLIAVFLILTKLVLASRKW